MAGDGGLLFSRRHGYRPEPEITVREDAPEGLRFWMLRAAHQLMGPVHMREVVCRVLVAAPDAGNQSNEGIWAEVNFLLRDCEWYKVYDVAEGFYRQLYYRFRTGLASRFEERLNELLLQAGVAWQMRSGKIVVRGSKPFEAATREAKDTLARHGRPTAAREVHEALQDLSRRPKPDLSGAVTHAMAALECVAGEVSGDSCATFGKLISRHAEAMGIRPPLDKALEKLWGYASEQGRHLREGREPRHEEAELVVGVAAAVSVYLSKRIGG